RGQPDRIPHAHRRRPARRDPPGVPRGDRVLRPRLRPPPLDFGSDAEPRDRAGRERADPRQHGPLLPDARERRPGAGTVPGTPRVQHRCDARAEPRSTRRPPPGDDQRGRARYRARRRPLRRHHHDRGKDGHRSEPARARPVRPRLREIDRPLAGVVVALAAYGLAALYSAGQTDVPTFVTTIWHKQLIWLAVGAIAAFLMFGLSPRLLEWATPYAYAIAVLVLL